MAARRERGLLDPDAAPGESPSTTTICVHRLRRRHRGGRLRRGVLARRPPAARQPRADLRRQPHLHRGRHRRSRCQRGRRRRATRPTAGTCRRSTGADDGTYDEDVAGAVRRARGGRAPRPTGRRSSRCARSSPGRRPNTQNTGKAHGSALGADEVAATKKVLGLRPGPDLRRRPGGARPRPRGRRPRPGRARRVEQPRSTPGPRPTRTRRQLLDRLRTRTAARRLGRRAARRSTPTPKGMATRKASGDGAQRDRAGAARAVGRLGRPGRVQQHHARRASRRSCPTEHQTKEFPGGPYGRVLHFGIREHAMGSIMNGIALHGGTRVVRRHVPGLQRLHAPGGPAGRADEAAGHLRLDARLDRPRRGRPDPPADRAPRRAAGDPRPGRGPAGRRQRDRRSPGGRSSSTPTGRPGCA